MNSREPPPIQLTLTPAQPPTPPLRYRLLPDARLLTTRDTVALYQQMAAFLDKPGFKESQPLLDLWRDLPVEQLPKAEMRQKLEKYAEIYDLLDQASRCDRCDWGMRDRLRAGAPNAWMIPEMSALRNAAQLLDLRVHLELAEGHFDQAVAVLRNEFVLARHVGECEAFISFLAGSACAAIAERGIERLLNCPHAPNLYFSLTVLPVPLVRLRRALESERLYTYNLFPGMGVLLGNPDAANLTEKQLADCLQSIEQLQTEITYTEADQQKWTHALQANDGNLTQEQVAGLVEAIKSFQPTLVTRFERQKLRQAMQDKHALAESAVFAAGWPRDKVEAMPSLQVALLHSFLEYDTVLDELLVWTDRPYIETAVRLNDLSQRFPEDAANAPAIPLLMSLISKVSQIVLGQVRVDRKLALLRTIEALRWYAARHDGNLPPSLAAVEEVPVPLDPVTGKAFEYEGTGGTATLRAPAPGNEIPYLGNTVVYELRLRERD